VRHLAYLGQLAIGFAVCFWSLIAMPQDDKWTEYMSRGKLAYNQAQHIEAYSQFALALKEANRFGAQDSRVILTLDAMAQTQFVFGTQEIRDGKFTDAIRSLEPALSTFKKSRPDDVITAEVSSNLGVAYERLGKYDEALNVYDQSLLRWQKALGSEDPTVGRSHLALGRVSVALKRWELAERRLRRSVIIWQKCGEKCNLDFADTLVEMAGIQKLKKEYLAAIDLLQSALGKRIRVYGEDSSIVVWTLDELADTYRLQGDRARAANFVARAEKLRSKLSKK
jgi:tetratricopeptide (TPR) repeat protein